MREGDDFLNLCEANAIMGKKKMEKQPDWNIKFIKEFKMITYKHDISVKAYNDMRIAVGWRKLDEQQAQTGLEHSVYTIAAYDEEKPVGMARIVGDGGYMYLIVDVMVLPAYQRKGIGRQMLNRVNSWLDQQSEGGLCIMVNLMATSGNEGFYEKLGYVTRPNDTMGAGMVRWING